MEGRTLARPDLIIDVDDKHKKTKLQWRAGHSPGQTATPIRDSSRATLASMEGRTLARPDFVDRMRFRAGFASFNGGPDTRPARPEPMTTSSRRQ